MDYPHPLITLKADGTMDLSQALRRRASASGTRSRFSYGYGEFPPATTKPPR